MSPTLNIQSHRNVHGAYCRDKVLLANGWNVGPRSSVQETSSKRVLLFSTSVGWRWKCEPWEIRGEWNFKTKEIGVSRSVLALFTRENILIKLKTKVQREKKGDPVSTKMKIIMFLQILHLPITILNISINKRLEIYNISGAKNEQQIYIKKEKFSNVNGCMQRWLFYAL